MKDIKTNNKILGTIKTLNKSKIMNEHLMETIIKTKENLQENDYDEENYASNKIENNIDKIKNKTLNESNKLGKNNITSTKNNIKSRINELKQKNKEKLVDNKIKNAITNEKIKIKSVGKANHNIKTAEKSSKVSIKTTEKIAKNAPKQIAKTKQRIERAKIIAKKVAKGIKVTVKATIKAVKALISGTKALISAIIAGGWIAIVIIIILCLIGLLVSYFTNDKDGNNIPQIVQIAKVEVETDECGGKKYWSWYGGFNERVEWCACFVSWCSNECGYIDNGVMPRYAVCDEGINWFKNKQEWEDRNSNYVPKSRRYNIF